MDDYHAYKSTSSGSGGGSGGGIGCVAWGVIIIFGIFLIYCIANGASWDAIDSALAIGFIAFLIANTVFK